ncbi:MAG: hypothetical protein GY874_24190 [Desulfobacteraceae bacterium]|nr:hypothetical protein [Desulfobacteraceae bacterium]
MDDFLHNLRSGKLKQSDRGNRQYNDSQYKAQRRNTMNQRKRQEPDNKDTLEHLSAIKEALESLAQTQKKMTVSYEGLIKAEERKATALEVLAKNICSIINPSAINLDNLFSSSKQSAVKPEQRDLFSADESDENGDCETDMDELAPKPRIESHRKAIKIAKKLSNRDRQSIYSLAVRMREAGNSWENIARIVASKDYPTVSGKGTWRGVMVKSLYEKMVIE